MLGTHFLGMLAEKEGRRKQLSPEALEAMRRYAWPGNVRELRNAIYTAYLLADGDRIDTRALPPEIEAVPRSRSTGRRSRSRRHDPGRSGTPRHPHHARPLRGEQAQDGRGARCQPQDALQPVARVRVWATRKRSLVGTVRAPSTMAAPDTRLMLVHALQRAQVRSARDGLRPGSHVVRRAPRRRPRGLMLAWSRSAGRVALSTGPPGAWIGTVIQAGPSGEAPPKMLKAASSRDVQGAFSAHLAETHQHVARLEQMFVSFDERPRGNTVTAWPASSKKAGLSWIATRTAWRWTHA